MSNVNVTYADLHDAATKLRTGKDELEQKLSELANYISSLVSDGFVTDQASGAFHDTYQHFTTGATQTVGALDDLAKFLDTAASSLEQTDAHLAQSIGS